MSDFSFPREGIILDASCAIKLYMSKYMGNILGSIPKQVVIAAYVRDIGAKYIYRDPVEDLIGETKAINLQPFIDDKLLQVVSLENEAEENMVVNFSAAGLGTGETITAAIAVLRQWSLGTDDKKSTSFFMRKVPQLHLLSTLDIIKHWIDTTDPQLTVIRLVLENIQNRAGYKPDDKHHLYGWWKQYTDTQYMDSQGGYRQFE